ncbi:MAG: hypothetical protein ABIK28_16075 [Planctomycetota bacterium]
MKRFLWVFIFCLASLWGLSLAADGEKQGPDPERHAAALKVIERNLDAVGGAERVRAIHSLKLKGGQGEMLTLPSLNTVFCLAGEGLFKQMSGTEVVLCNGEKQVFDAGGGEQPLPEDYMDNIAFQLALMRKGFSLLLWESYFDRAEYLGKKRHGAEKEYVVLIPEAQDRHDVTLYFDTETYLIKRIVFKVEHDRAKALTRVTRLKDYRTFDDLRIPTTLYFERVGWKEEGLQMVFSDCTINPEFDDALFESAELEYGTVTRHGDRLIGEVRADRFTLMHTNASDEDMEAIGIRDNDRVVIAVGEKSIEAKYVRNFVPSQEEQQSRSQNILCRHPRAGYARLIVLPVPGFDLAETFSFDVGDRFVISRAKQDEERESGQAEDSKPAMEENKNEPHGG